jgi:Ca-activated chloride channel family protein
VDPRRQPTRYFTQVVQVEVFASVTGADGRPIRGLTRDDFTVLEDDVPQRIATFGDGEAPAAVALAVDRSFSMRDRALAMARSASRAFVAALKPADRAMLISISGQVEVLAPLGTDRTPLLIALDALDPWSTTALNDAVIRSLDLMDREAGRRAVVLLSDGVDRYSEASAGDVVDRARASDVLLYPVALGRSRPGLFVELATVTGGRSFHVPNGGDLQSALREVAEDLRNQYLIGYEPSGSSPREDVEWHTITVRVTRPGVRVRARSGYRAR